MNKTALAGGARGLAAAMANVAPTKVFITAWLRQHSEAENIRVNE